jgi:RNA-directed DNA polymerase
MADTPIEDWACLPWRKLERHVYRLQKRMYRASCRGNVRAVHSLQRLLLKARAARCLAVRRVTQDNQGKKTAGIDGIKSVGPGHRILLVTLLRTPARIKAQPTRRVWIPKPGKSEQRPLGIPVMLDRAHQALVKLALEPEWEARFEADSYGFRPGRSAHDAIEAIYLHTRRKEKYVLDADIQGCFDNIAKEPLLEKLHTYPALRRTIKSWLTAGVVDSGVFHPTERGTPQGGVISPLLANIALHGMGEAIRSAFTTHDRPAAIRYADDFVILHPTLAGVEKARNLVESWLHDMGLNLKGAKTRITHTLHAHEGAVGFDFLGFTIRQYPVGQCHAGHDAWGNRLAFKMHTTPSKEAVKRHQAELQHIVRAHRAATQQELVEALNPVIVGWTNYYRTVVAKQTFNVCDHTLFQLLWRWARFRHPRKGRAWRRRKYWRTIGQNHWRFGVPEGAALAQHARTAIRRHVKVRGTASPFDGNLIYWSQRLRQHPLLQRRLASLLTRQGGRCSVCSLLFRDTDRLEVDHVEPRMHGGPATYANLQVLHRHCHDQKTRQAALTTRLTG